MGETLYVIYNVNDKTIASVTTQEDLEDTYFDMLSEYAKEDLVIYELGSRVSVGVTFS